MIRAGILGATGYMGGEALRVLLEHPQVEIAWATSRSGGDIADYHPNLYGTDITLISPDAITPCDVVFMALPTEASLGMAKHLLDMGCKVIDLGAAFRLADRTIWETAYGQKHTSWDLAQQAVYGVSELHRENITQANLIANPGCFSSAVILGLAPLVTEDIIDTQKIIVNGLSGTAGVGAELSRAAHHPEIGNNLVPYNVVGHRHTHEMEQELSQLSDDQVTVHFTPTYVPITRGILAICHVFPKQAISRSELLEYYRDFYSDDPFTNVYDLPDEEAASWHYKSYPWVSTIAGTNYCNIGMDIDQQRNRIVIFSVLDSLGKGGAQAGVENMNLMFGLDRTSGLKRRGLHPN